MRRMLRCSSGQGENPYRRYSPRALYGLIRCNSETDSESLDGRRAFRLFARSHGCLSAPETFSGVYLFVKMHLAPNFMRCFKSKQKGRLFMSGNGREAVVQGAVARAPRMGTKGLFTARNIAQIAALSALAAILQVFEIGGFPFVMPWLKMDFSDVPALLASFGMGPLAGVFVELIKNFFKLQSSSSGGVGEIANFVTGICLVVPAGWIYRRERTKKGALIGMAVGAVLFCTAGALLNLFVLLPLYANLFMGGTQNVIDVAQQFIPSIQSLTGVAVLGTTPFNLFKSILLSFVTVLLYKPLSPLIRIRK